MIFISIIIKHTPQIGSTTDALCGAIYITIISDGCLKLRVRLSCTVPFALHFIILYILL